MLYGAEDAVCFEIDTKYINNINKNNLWAERKIPKCQTCWFTQSAGLKRLMEAAYSLQHP
jgi:hypothetical protein